MKKKQDPERTVPYQFYVPSTLRAFAVGKAHKAGCNLSQFMLMAMEQFADQPITDSVRALQTHNRRKR